MKACKAQLQEAVASSMNKRQVLMKLGVTPAGGNYIELEKALHEHNIDTSHFRYLPQNPGKRRPIEDYLANLAPISSHKLRKRLIREGLLNAQCNRCEGTEWLGQPIPLELDHIDGNKLNNSLDNLQVLCPNCHSFTPHYRGRKKKLPKPTCIDCPAFVSGKGRRCRSCAGKKRYRAVENND